MSDIELGDLSDLRDGQLRCFEHIGRDGIVVCRVAGRLYALDDNCSHADTPLSEGRLRGHRLTCPLHGASFDVRTGEHSGPPAWEGVPCHAVEEVDGVAVVVMAGGHGRNDDPAAERPPQPPEGSVRVGPHGLATFAAMATELPTTTSAITAEWMTEALRASGVIGPDTSVASVHLDATAAGVGFMGEIGRVGVTYAGAPTDAPTSLIAKFPTASPEVRAMFHPSRIYEREHRFYAELASRSPLRTPEVYHVVCETAEAPDDERYLILMEDLSTHTPGDQVGGLSTQQAEAALVALAGHHAAFWNGAGLEDADFVPIINGPLNQVGVAVYEASLPGFMTHFEDAIKPELRSYVANYASVRTQIIDDLEAMPHTLVHFDFRADNLLYDADGSVAVVDWQTISQGGGAADVGYFLSQNLSTDDRRTHETALLRAYHDALVAHGVTDYEFESLQADYRVGITCGWVIPVLAVGTLDFTSDRAVALWTAVIERVQNALIDHGYGD